MIVVFREYGEERKEEYSRGKSRGFILATSSRFLLDWLSLAKIELGILSLSVVGSIGWLQSLLNILCHHKEGLLHVCRLLGTCF